MRSERWLQLLFTILIISIFASCKFSDDHSQSSIAKKSTDKYSTDEMTIQHGTELFNLHCASCHDFFHNMIGPNLAGITSKVDKSWLIKFIANSPAMIEAGDERSVTLFEEYKQYMPAFPMLSDDDIEDILGFIHKFSQEEKRSKNNRLGGLINPIPEKIPNSDLTLVLMEQFKVPGIADMNPLTRINQMGYSPDGRNFIHDIRGKLYQIMPDNSLTTHMDLSEHFPNFATSPGKGSGFASWTFHPDFVRNGLLYTTHTEEPGSAPADYPIPDSITVDIQAVLSEWKIDDPLAATFSGTQRELLRVDMVSGGHTFQQVTFNPLAKPGDSDYGKLYLGIGDGVAAVRGYPFLCDDTHIWGSVIRIDPAGSNSINGNYGIPKDNPFVNDPNSLDEIWASGFRNPHRITWDETGTDKMIITNIGQHSLEEINIGKAGANYGWPFREGTFLFDLDANIELVYPLPEDDAGYTYPVVQYDHDEGSAISGGFVYAGSNIPILRGKYIYGDMSRGYMYYSEIAEMNQGELAPVYRLNVSMDGELTNMETIASSIRVDLRIGIDSDRELYLFSKGNGGVYKIVDCVEKAELQNI